MDKTNTLVGNYKVSNGSTLKRFEIGSKLTIDDITDVFLVCLLAVLNIFQSLLSVFNVNYEKVNTRWAVNYSDSTGIYQFKVSCIKTRKTSCESCK